MRKTITAFHKPPKVRAEKKSRKTSKPVAAQSDDLIEKLIAEANGDAAPAPAPTEEKPKNLKNLRKKEVRQLKKKPKKEKKAAEKPKKEKKTKETAPAEVVTEPVEPVAVAPVEKPKKEKKTKEASATTEEKPKKEKKAPAAKKSSKKEETVPEPAAAAPADDSDEIQTRIVTIEGGKQFLIDQDYNLYDINTHEEIGKFDPVTQQPILA